MARPKAGYDSYKDVRPIWHAALAYNGAVHECANYKQAKELIQRLHAFRMMDRKISFDGENSLFDDFVVTNPEPTIIRIQRRAVPGITRKLNGELVDMDYMRNEIESLDADKHSKSLGFDVNDYIERHKPARGDHDIDPDAPLDLD